MCIYSRMYFVDFTYLQEKNDYFGYDDPIDTVTNYLGNEVINSKNSKIKND